MTTAEKIIRRNDGSEVRIVAETCYGRGLTCSIDVYVHQRESPDQPWMLMSNRPHPDWRKMSVDDYLKRGRSEMLRTVSHGEILKVTSALTFTTM
ncbi:TPA: hypothetical protein ACYLN4_007254 [Burkholderia lata]